MTGSDVYRKSRLLEEARNFIVGGSRRVVKIRQVRPRRCQNEIAHRYHSGRERVFIERIGGSRTVLRRRRLACVCDALATGTVTVKRTGNDLFNSPQ
jgi:hypothetical protein